VDVGGEAFTVFPVAIAVVVVAVPRRRLLRSQLCRAADASPITHLDLSLQLADRREGGGERGRRRGSLHRLPHRRCRRSSDRAAPPHRRLLRPQLRGAMDASPVTHLDFSLQLADLNCQLRSNDKEVSPATWGTVNMGNMIAYRGNI